MFCIIISGDNIIIIFFSFVVVVRCSLIIFIPIQICVIIMTQNKIEHKWEKKKTETVKKNDTEHWVLIAVWRQFRLPCYMRKGTIQFDVIFKMWASFAPKTVYFVDIRHTLSYLSAFILLLLRFVCQRRFYSANCKWWWLWYDLLSGNKSFRLWNVKKKPRLCILCYPASKVGQ